MQTVTESLARMSAIIKLELIRLLRDRTSFSLIAVVPVLQIILFGAAVNLNPKGVEIAVAGGGPGLQDRVETIIESTGYFAPVIAGLPAGHALERLQRGHVQVALELPDDTDFFDAPESSAENAAEGNVGTVDAQELSAGRVRLYVDGADPAAVGPAVAALEVAGLRAAIKTLSEGAGDEGGLESPAAQVTWLYNPERKTSWTILPALMGVIVMISALMLGALTVVREREQGTWDSLKATPARPHEIFFGKLTPYLGIAGLQIMLSLLVATQYFGVPVAGSLVGLMLGALLVAAIHLALGFMLSLVVMSQLQALQGAVAFYLPSMLLSGFMFPFSAMPEWARTVGSALPLTHYVSLARACMLRGAGFADVAGTLTTLAAIFLILFLLALGVFRAKA